MAGAGVDIGGAHPFALNWFPATIWILKGILRHEELTWWLVVEAQKKVYENPLGKVIFIQ